MKLVLRVLGVTVLSLGIEMPEDEVEEEDEDWEGIERLTTSDLSFGFAADPVFPLFEWDDDEDRERKSHEGDNQDDD